MVSQASEDPPGKHLARLLQVIACMWAVPRHRIASTLGVNRDPLLEAHRGLERFYGVERFGLGELQQAQQVIVVEVRVTFGLEPDRQEEVLPGDLAPEDRRQPSGLEPVEVAARPVAPW